MNARVRSLVFALPLLLGACEWFTDFKRQPSLWTWEPVKDSLTPSRGNPQNSVPTTGTFMAGAASTNGLLFAVATWLVLAWKTAGWIGLDRWLLRALGTPWRPGYLFTRDDRGVEHTLRRVA